MNRTKLWLTRLLPLILILTVIAAISVSVFAKYVQRTQDVVNNFTPSKSVLPTVEENFDGDLKTDV